MRKFFLLVFPRHNLGLHFIFVQGHTPEEINLDLGSRFHVIKAGISTSWSGILSLHHPTYQLQKVTGKIP